MISKTDVLNRVRSNGIAYLRGDDSTKSKVGIHLLDPTLLEIDNAIDTAVRDSFPVIYYYRSKPDFIKLVVNNVKVKE